MSVYKFRVKSSRRWAQQQEKFHALYPYLVA